MEAFEFVLIICLICIFFSNREKKKERNDSIDRMVEGYRRSFVSQNHEIIAKCKAYVAAQEEELKRKKMEEVSRIKISMLDALLRVKAPGRAYVQASSTL